MSGRKRIVKIKSLKNQAFIADKCVVAESFFDRLQGLIGKRELAPGEAMLFPRCNDIHMWFMTIPIDVVFLTRAASDEGEERFVVSSVREGVRPWKLLPVMDLRASVTLEMAAGSVAKFDIRPGDPLCTS